MAFYFRDKNFRLSLLVACRAQAWNNLSSEVAQVETKVKRNYIR